MNKYIECSTEYKQHTNVLYQSAARPTTAHRVTTSCGRWYGKDTDYALIEATSHFKDLPNEKVYMYLDLESLKIFVNQLQNTLGKLEGIASDTGATFEEATIDETEEICE